jgi:hypothetical protein
LAERIPCRRALRLPFGAPAPLALPRAGPLTATKLSVALRAKTRLRRRTIKGLSGDGVFMRALYTRADGV